jgi:hypothetical protein
MSIQVTIRYQGPLGLAWGKAPIATGARATFRLAAVALMFLGTTIGGLEIGYGVWTFSTVVRAAHLGARFAEIHGAEAAGSPADKAVLNREIEQIIVRNAGDLRAGALNIVTTWPEKTTSDQAIRVRVAYPLRFFTGSLTLAGESAGSVAPRYEMVVTN